ncbi:MAG: hypothetical protein ACO3R5_10180 [Pseudohongiellaceae bacterium]
MVKSDVKGHSDFGGKTMTCSYERRVGHDYTAVNRTAAASCLALHTERLAILLFLAAAISCLWSARVFAANEMGFFNSLSQGSSVQYVSITPVKTPSVSQQQARIAELQKQSMRDTYDPELGEAYLELANSLSAEGNHDGALNAYSNALQVVRVTEGLNSLNQLPILKAQLEIHEQTNEWHRVDETLSLIHAISQDQLPVGDDRRVEAMNQISRWRLRAAEEELLETSAKDHSKLVELYEEELRQVELYGSANISDLALSSLKIGEAFARLSLAMNTLDKPLSEYRAVTSRPIKDRTPCQTVQRGSRGGVQPCMAGARPNLDYYLAPQRQKDKEVRKHLEALRISIIDAAKTLEDRNDFAGRDLLVEDFRFLAETFTGIVSR